METGGRNPEERSNEDSTKRTRSRQKSPNQDRRKKQHSFMSMELEDKLEAEVKEMGLAMTLLDEPVRNTTPTLNKTTPPLQHCVLLGVSVKNSDITGLKQHGGLINNQAIGASLAILQNLLLSQLIQNNNSNSQIQHVLISPSTLKSIPVTFTGLNKTIRKNVSDALILPTVGNLNKKEYQPIELRLRIIAPFKDILTDPDKNIHQWGLDMHKLPGEDQCGCITRYFHPSHEAASDCQRTSVFNHVKSEAEKIRALVKSNFNDKKTGFFYKRNKNDPSDPVRLDTVTATAPNDSGIIVLLTVAVLIKRTAFWSEPESVVSLYKKVVGTYIIEQQRNNLFNQLESELNLRPTPGTEKKTGPRWGKQDINAQSDKIPGGS